MCKWKSLIIINYIFKRNQRSMSWKIIHRLNLDKNLDEYLEEVVVEEDFEYCYETNLMALKRV